MPLVLLAEEAEGEPDAPRAAVCSRPAVKKSTKTTARAVALTSLSDLDHLWVGDSGSGPGFRP